ncbi:hypothetical protein BGX27_010917 [Mortierella sp. AM989]|nr:hypothetical protein BGX27_010917 [Mortierella sp. AM989]
MKFTLSLAVLAIVASQAMAVIPEPIQACTKSVLVVETDVDGCDAFAARHNTTFPKLMEWNGKLRKDCLNLDVGHPICVSITKGDCCLATAGVTPLPSSTTAGVAPTSAPAGATTTAKGTATAAPSGNTTAPTSASSKPSVTGAPPTVTGSGAAGLKSSMMLAAAGVVLSVAYML